MITWRKVGCCLVAVAGFVFAAVADGGPIYRVAQVAAGAADGSSWEDAMSLDNGIAAVAAGGELWLKSGTYALAANVPTLTASGEVVVRGGFAGTETDVAERPKDGQSTLDGQDLYTTFTVVCTKPVTIERLVLTRSIMHGVKKTGSSNITISQCDFTHNGRINYTEGVSGRCGNFSGGGAVTISDCRAYANWGETYMNYIGTSGFWFSQITKATIERTTFERNGYFGVGRWNSCGIIYCVQTPLVMSGCLVRGNRVTTDNGSGLIYLYQSGTGSVIKNCLFIGNEHLGAGTGVVYANYAWGAANTLSVENCTFAYNLCRASNGAAALTFDMGTFTVKNCLFTGNLVGKSATSGADISLTGANATCSVSYSMFDGTEETKALHYAAPAGTLKEGAGIRFGNPNLVSPLDDFTALLTTPETTFPRATTDTPAFLPFLTDDEQFAKIQELDAHLLSSGGYFTNDGSEHLSETAISPAIDKGDPTSPIGAEPEPNGGLINIGAYGGTAQASKTPAAAEPAVSSVSVLFASEYTQPTVTFTLGGSGAYSAEARVYLSTDGGESWSFVSDAISDLARGDSRSYLVPTHFEPGAFLTAKVELTVGEIVVSGQAEPVQVSGALPPWAGKGGDPETVIHVRPGAACKRDGTSWSDAVNTLEEAFAAVTETRNEIWVAGAFAYADDKGTKTFSKSFTLRGGFAGTENEASERADGAKTLIDGNEKSDGLAFQNLMPITVEGFRFVHGRTHGLVKGQVGGQASGSLTIKDCDFVANGHYWVSPNSSTANPQGGGALLTGAGTEDLVLENCLFEENTVTNNGSNPITWPHCGEGAGAAIQNFANVRMTGCRFVRNGGCSIQQGFRQAGSRALFVKNAVTEMKGCEFRGNVGNTWQGSGPTVKFDGACGGSSCENCLWAGNLSSNGTNPLGASALQIGLASSDDAFTIANCTFAYNVCDSDTSPTALKATKGAVEVKNSIFFGNVSGGSATVGSDIHATADATVDCSYTLFDGTDSDFVSGTVTLNETCLTGDPRFVTDADAVRTMLGISSFPGKVGHPVAYFGNLDSVCMFDLHVLKRSPAIDAGAPASSVGDEPAPNGHRINLGCYGGTAEAMCSSAGLILIIH